MPDFEYEKKVWKRDFKFVAGVDEVGRGAWAGPVVAGAVVWPALASARSHLADSVKINDSKKLNVKQREIAEAWIKKNCLAWGIGEVSASTIDKIGIVKATERAFRRALAQCNARLVSNISNGSNFSNIRRVDFLLIDAFYIPYVRGLRRKNQLAIVKGDEKSISVASASIIAKVYRDKLMVRHARPGLARPGTGRHLAKLGRYGWERNKGYGTKEHQEAIAKHGLSRLHRKSFVPQKLLKD